MIDHGVDEQQEIWKGTAICVSKVAFDGKGRGRGRDALWRLVE